MPHAASLFLLGAGGALAGELLKVYELRGKLDSAKYKQLARSWIFWGVLLGMLLASGFIAWAVNANVSTVEPLQVVLTGVGARGVVRGASEAGSANRPATLGGKDERVGLSDLFA